MAISSRGESGVGGGSRGSGGITGSGGKWVNPKYKEVTPSVKVVKPDHTKRTIKPHRSLGNTSQQ